MSIWRLIIKKVAPTPKLLDFERYLFIGPHPDDIEVGAGGTAARLCQMGKEVYFVIATDGRYGTEDIDTNKDELIKIRQQEALAAAKKIGVKEVIFLPFHDGGLYSTNELTKSLTIQIASINPDVVFAPDPLLDSECHADHIKTGRAASSAYLMATNPLLVKDLGGKGLASPKALAYYYTASPNGYVCVSKSQKIQFSALKEYKSQFTYTEDGKGTLNLIMLYLKLRSIRFGIKKLKGRAEGFRVLGPLNVHCFAEKL